MMNQARVRTPEMRIVELAREHAEDICTWRYPAPYDCYDMTGVKSRGVVYDGDSSLMVVRR